jgi:uncharacterized protein DUF1707/2TM domain-containing protein
MGMEHDPNIPGRQPDLRASDADRAQIIELLRRHHQDGRLTAEELAERIERVNAATTFGDLDASMANLPRLLPPLTPSTATVQERTPGAARQTFYRVLFAYVVINLFLIGIWAFSGRGAFWPIWVMLGWGLAMAFYAFWVFGPQSGRSR